MVHDNSSGEGSKAWDDIHEERFDHEVDLKLFCALTPYCLEMNYYYYYYRLLEKDLS